MSAALLGLAQTGCSVFFLFFNSDICHSTPYCICEYRSYPLRSLNVNLKVHIKLVIIIFFFHFLSCYIIKKRWNKSCIWVHMQSLLLSFVLFVKRRFHRDTAVHSISIFKPLTCSTMQHSASYDGLRLGCCVIYCSHSLSPAHGLPEMVNLSLWIRYPLPRQQSVGTFTQAENRETSTQGNFLSSLCHVGI